MNNQPDTQRCTYCRVDYPYPVELHHSERECYELRAAASAVLSSLFLGMTAKGEADTP